MLHWCVAVINGVFFMSLKSKASLPDGPGQMKLPVQQIDLHKAFFYILYQADQGCA